MLAADPAVTSRGASRCTTIEVSGRRGQVEQIVAHVEVAAAIGHHDVGQLEVAAEVCVVGVDAFGLLHHDHAARRQLARPCRDRGAGVGQVHEEEAAVDDVGGRTGQWHPGDVAHERSDSARGSAPCRLAHEGGRMCRSRARAPRGRPRRAWRWCGPGRSRGRARASGRATGRPSLRATRAARWLVGAKTEARTPRRPTRRRCRRRRNAGAGDVSTAAHRTHRGRPRRAGLEQRAGEVTTCWAGA